MMRSLALACVVMGASADSVELTSENWGPLVANSGKSAFVKFLAPW